MPHQTQPTIGHVANLHVLATLMHMTKPAEFADPYDRMHVGLRESAEARRTANSAVPAGPGLGFDESIDAELRTERARSG